MYHNERQMAQTKQISVLIVDDHAAVRSGLMISLKAFGDIRPVAAAVSGIESLCLCCWFQPDVVLMGLNIAGLDGVMATRVVRQLYKNTQVVMLANFTDEEDIIQKALLAGAIGCLRKDVPANTMAEVIRTAHRGEVIPWAS